MCEWMCKIWRVASCILDAEIDTKCLRGLTLVACHGEIMFNVHLLNFYLVMLL